ncbi:hypothetical protein EIP86_010302 [Pleurotus ostreatoroseus]|nr:hypothetical protein EIP86_010302 [Pleurotus ostreatoroseus]
MPQPLENTWDTAVVADATRIVAGVKIATTTIATATAVTATVSVIAIVSRTTVAAAAVATTGKKGTGTTTEETGTGVTAVALPRAAATRLSTGGAGATQGAPLEAAAPPVPGTMTHPRQVHCPPLTGLNHVGNCALLVVTMLPFCSCVCGYESSSEKTARSGGQGEEGIGSMSQAMKSVAVDRCCNVSSSSILCFPA